MAIAYNLEDLQDDTSSGTTITSDSFTVNAGGYLLVPVGIKNNPGNAPTSATFDGGAMTLLVESLPSDAANDQPGSAFFGLQVAGNTTGPVVVTCGGSNSLMSLAAISITGHDAADPIAGVADDARADSSGTTPGLTVPSVAGAVVFDALAAFINYAGGIVMDGAQTLIVDAELSSDLGFGVSSKVASGVSTTMAWSRVTNNWSWRYCAVAIRPASGGGGGGSSGFLLLTMDDEH